MRLQKSGRWLVSACALGLALSLTACGGPAPTSSEGGGGDEQVTINYWGFAPKSTTADKYKEAFEDAHPNIKINFRVVEITDYPATLRPGLQSDSGPDVFPLAAGGAIAGAFLFEDAVEDLTPLAKATLGDDFADKFGGGYIEQLSSNGKLLASPFVGVTAQYFWYNKDLFDQHQLTPPTNYDEMKKVCDTFKAAGVQCFVGGFGGDLPFGGELMRTIANSIQPGYWEDAIKGKVSWESPVITESVDIMRKMQADGIIAEDAIAIQQYPEANNIFQSQKAAMIQMGSWYAQYDPKDVAAEAQKAAGVTDPVMFTQLTMPAPDLSGKGNMPQPLGEVDWGVAISKRSQHKAEAEEFVKFLTMTEEGQRFGCSVLEGVPTLKGVEPDWPNLNLSNPEQQEANIKQIISDSLTTTETRNRWIGPETAEAILQLVQGALTTQNPAAELAAKAQQMAKPLPGAAES
ncbi:MAG: ABC transporter substrate-binding protein [Propionibacteriaceae bacterium]|nr:ABC transporter substrate-binding protein [Propionibacteriaceae bacterium]